MVDACCEGLRRRSELGRGGTARSVPFAIRVCSGQPIDGDDLKDMLAHFGAIEREMEHRLGDPVLETAWLLWGGDPGVEWADGYLHRAMAAAPNDPEPTFEQPEWMGRLNQLARDERSLLARIHELCEAGMEVALSKVHAKVVNALSRPSQALKASLGGLDRRDEVLAAMREHTDPAVSLAAIPRPLMARLGPTAADRDLIRSLFAQHTLGRVDQLVAAHTSQVLDALRPAAADPVVVAQLADDLAVARSKALDRLGVRLLDLAGEFLSDSNPLDLGDGEVPVGRVPGSLAWDTLSDCGGGNPDQPGVQDWATVNGADLLASGVAVGVLVLRALDRLSTTGALLAAAAVLNVVDGPELDVVTVTTWRWGGSKRPFPPHQQLDGETWETEADRAGVVRNTERFPPGEGYYPGDHAGCSCSLEVQLKVRQAKPGRATLRPFAELQVARRREDGVETAFARAVGSPRVEAISSGRFAVPDSVAILRERPDTVVKRAALEQVEHLTGPLSRLAMTKEGRVSVTWSDEMLGGLYSKSNAITVTRTGRIMMNAERMTGARRPPSTGFIVGNAQKVSDAEYTFIHEWGHTIHPDSKAAEGWWAKLRGEAKTAANLSDVWPSEYAATNGAEMFAEAWTDWVIDPAAAHATSKRLAAVFKWPTPDVPLKDLSLLRK